MYLHTGVPQRSACNCIRRLFVDIFPSVFNLVNGKPQSLYIASKISLVWKQTASNDALIICCFVVNAVSPQIILWNVFNQTIYIYIYASYKSRKNL